MRPIPSFLDRSAPTASRGRHHLRRLAAATALTAAALTAFPQAAPAAPTCTVAGTEPACGGRIVAEPEQSTTFVQYDLEFPAVLDALEALAPDVVDVYTLDELTGNPEHVSAGGRNVYVVRVTDESVPADDKVQAVASLSIHGNESAGREGGIRYIEDLARWSIDDPDRELYAGDIALPLSQVLADVELWLGFVNPDGWAMGDFTDPEFVTFDRGNSNGADLNREFPTTGWTKRENTQLSEPEARGWVEFVSSLPNLTTATDVHGELTSETNSFSDMMWPAAQWTPDELAKELQLAEHMTGTIERKFEEAGIVVDDLVAALGGTPAESGGVATKPAQYATAYDIVGYDDSGFMGDWFAKRGATEIDVENFLSHLVPGNVWNGALEQAHVAAVRGILESLAVEALLTNDVEATLDLGTVAYVLDPETVSSTDENGFGFSAQDGETPQHYDVTRMQYFEDLSADAGVPITPLTVAQIATTDLSAYDTIVVADNPFPDDGADVSRAEYAAALGDFAADGGQLLLTDGAVELLVDLEVVGESDVQTGYSEAGHVVFGETDHPWEADLKGLPEQTYYEVPLGYRAGSGVQEAPHHGVTTDAWEAAGGTTVGTSTGFTSLGELPFGNGKVAIFGAILPTQTEDNPHVYGLADYAVTVNGGAVMQAILSYERAADEPDAPSAESTDEPALPTTGGGLVLVGLATLTGAAALRRRRT